MKLYKSNCPELKLKNADGTVRKAQIKTSKQSNEFFRAIFEEETLEVCESFIAIYLNRANITCGWFKASQGGISGTVVDVRLILKKALDCYATSIIVAHNHPSGNLYPSEADKLITRKIKGAAETMDITLIDHVIITKENYYSFADEGQI